MLDLADRLISKAGPFAAAGIMVGSIYWTAVTYGAVTVMQVRFFSFGILVLVEKLKIILVLVEKFYIGLIFQFSPLTLYLHHDTQQLGKPV